MSNNQIYGYVSLLYSVADKPLELWSKHVALGGKIRRVKDDALYENKVIEIVGPHDSAVLTNITIPAKTLDVLNIKLPILALVMKNLNLHFKLEIQIIDKEHHRRRFSFTTYNLEKLPSFDTSIARIPLKLEESWNSLEINLRKLCCEVYKTDYEALQRIIIYPNCRLRRIYLLDHHYNHDETPIEIYQAFFDMYMLKRGSGFIERACQTECYTGSLEQQCEFNCFVKRSTIVASSTKADVFKNECSIQKLKNLNALDVSANLCNSASKLKRNNASLNILNSDVKTHSNHNAIIKYNQCYSKLVTNNVKNKLKKNNSDIMKKEKKQNTIKIHKTENSNSLINIKMNNHMSAAFIQQKRTGKGQFLKTHVDEALFVDSKFPKRSYSHRIRNAVDTVKNYRLNNSNNNINTNKSNVNSVNAKFRASVTSFSTTRPHLSRNLKLDCDKINDNIIGTRNNKLHTTISKNKDIEEDEKSITNNLESLISIEENTEDICIPPQIEKAAKLDEVKSRYTADKTISDFAATCYFINRRFFEKLRDKGLVPQIELSTYAINGRNFYGQEKFIEKQRWCIDKCIGL